MRESFQHSEYLSDPNNLLVKCKNTLEEMNFTLQEEMIRSKKLEEELMKNEENSRIKEIEINKIKLAYENLTKELAEIKIKAHRETKQKEKVAEKLKKESNEKKLNQKAQNLSSQCLCRSPCASNIRSASCWARDKTRWFHRWRDL